MFGFKYLFGSDFDHTLESRINPATGLPMIENADIDIAGNIFGTDSASSITDSSFDFTTGITSGFGFDD